MGVNKEYWLEKRWKQAKSILGITYKIEKKESKIKPKQVKKKEKR